MTAQFPTLIALAFCLVGAPPALAGDGAMDRRNGAALATLHGLDSTGALFLPVLGVASPGAIVPLSPADQGADMPTANVLAQIVDGPAANAAPSRAPAGAIASIVDGAARGGGTNLYGFTRDPRATILTPAGVRFANPMLLQSVKASGIAASQFKQFGVGK
jgi:hypothetical protein